MQRTHLPNKILSKNQTECCLLREPHIWVEPDVPVDDVASFSRFYLNSDEYEMRNRSELTVCKSSYAEVNIYSTLHLRGEYPCVKYRFNNLNMNN